MQPYIANALNGLVLVLMSLWGYYETSSNTALIPAVGGIILLILNGPLKRGNKTLSHVIVVLTVLLIIALIKPFTGALADGRTMAVFRISAMLVTGILAIISFVISFRNARLRK